MSSSLAGIWDHPVAPTPARSWSIRPS